jgi:hypothetical protein
MNMERLQATLSGRRDFAKTLGMASAGIAAFFARAEAQSTITDADIVQFALNLEYLEAEFYTVARTGKTIDQFGVAITGSGTGGATTGGQMVTFFNNSSLALSADQIAADERAHVTLLRTALAAAGATPVAKPAINLNALGTGFESQEAFIALARAFEDTGVSAYGGAAPLIQDKTILGYAARILATEAEHAANLRLHAVLYQAATKALDGADVTTPPTGTQYFSTNALGLTPVRTPGQVLNIVYGGAVSAAKGGFFPNGVNGNINTSSAAATANV